MLKTDAPPAGPEQAKGAASRQRPRAHNKPGTTAGIQGQHLGLKCSATSRSASQRHEPLTSTTALGSIYIEIIGFAVLKTLLKRCASQRRNLAQLLQLPQRHERLHKYYNFGIDFCLPSVVCRLSSENHVDCAKKIRTTATR